MPANTSQDFVPAVVGWGGARLEDAHLSRANNTISEVFPSQKASNLEMQVQRLASLGYNGFRVDFESQCTNWKEDGPYNATNLERAFSIAEHFNFWIIVDYHGFNDTSTALSTNCWLVFWTGLLEEFRDRYYRTIWEPLNEPMGIGTGAKAVQYLSSAYQSWINQARSLHDTSWIVVQNLCSFACSFKDLSQGYPTVSDSQGRILLSIHPYMSYRYYWRSWNNATAESLAVNFYNAMLEGQRNTGWHAFNTEGGPGGTFNGKVNCPDLMVNGSAGWCRTNFHFVQKITELSDSTPLHRVSWVWWTMGDWTDTPGAGLYGALKFLKHRTSLLGDVNGDCRVDMTDVSALVKDLGRRAGDPAFNPSTDLNDDGVVNTADLTIIIQLLGTSCPS